MVRGSDDEDETESSDYESEEIEKGDGIDPEESEDSETMEEMLEGKISDTLEYLIRIDRREIEELLTGFEKEEDEIFNEDIAKLRQLTESWIEDEVLGKNTTLRHIESLLRKLSNSEQLKMSELSRFEAILKDINHNRHRVTSILRGMVPVLIQKDFNPKEVWHELKRLESEQVDFQRPV